MSAATLTKLSLRLNRNGAYGKKLPGVILMTDERRLPDPLAAAARLPLGSAIILRHYDDPGRAALGRDLIILCRRRGLRLLVAGDWRLAWRLGAHGLHLPQWQVPRLWTARPGWLITAAAHSHGALNRAARHGVHAALLSPVFPTASHPGGHVLGSLNFAKLTGGAALPVYGLGGITTFGARRLLHSGAVGIAAISGLSP
jgi:thiamine-phosphate pyrophosphorylase